MDAFTDTLCAEITMRASRDAGPLTSVFFGGGTPSLLAPEAMGRIVEHIRSLHAVHPDAEWTMECNPGTVTEERLRGYRALGINRLSFGVQSFTESELKFLDRIHSADEADAAMAMARAAGFGNVNMDLMFAVPGQTMESFDYNLQRMLRLEPDHISAYSLIYEHGTPLFARLQKGLVVPTSEDTDVAMYARVIHTLTSAGYVQYEVSNFARPGRQCRHNLTYWHAENYIAVGPSAHGYVDGTRYWNHRSLSAWTSKVRAGALPEANRETLTLDDERAEFLFLTLRADGIPVDTVRERFGTDLRTTLQPHLGDWIEAGFIVDTGTHLVLTGEGYRVCDEITTRVVL